MNEFRLAEADLRFRVREYVSNFRSLQPVVQRDSNHPCFEARKVKLNSLKRVAPMDGNAVSGLEACHQEPPGKGIGGPIQRFKGELLVVADERNSMRCFQ
jgi:hypothetical protein